jgi:hypothetical protein
MWFQWSSLGTHAPMDIHRSAGIPAGGPGLRASVMECAAAAALWRRPRQELSEGRRARASPGYEPKRRGTSGTAALQNLAARLVAQAASLLYRRLPVGRSFHSLRVDHHSQVGNLRYSRLATCATSALAPSTINHQPPTFRLSVPLALLAAVAVLVPHLHAESTPRPSAARVKLLCDLARTIQWPETNQVLAVALFKFSDEDAREIRRLLESVSPAPWRGVWVTNYTFVPRGVENLPPCGIFAMSGVNAREIRGIMSYVPARAFLTVGEGFQGFEGMINLSANGALVVNRRKIETAGLGFPAALLEGYERSGVRVITTER